MPGQGRSSPRDFAPLARLPAFEVAGIVGKVLICSS
jgi:hypothetical protein